MSSFYDVIGQDALVPMIYVKASGAAAATGTVTRPSLLVGFPLASGTAVLNTAVRVSSLASAHALFGAGSMLARMYDLYRRNDPYGDVYCLPVAAPAAGTAATTILHLTGPATADGVLNLYITGQRLSIPVATGDTATEIGAAIQTALGVDEAAAVTAGSTFPVTASNSAGTVTISARHKGAIGKQIDIRVNYLGDAGSESLPAGVAITELASARLDRKSVV